MAGVLPLAPTRMHAVAAGQLTERRMVTPEVGTVCQLVPSNDRRRPMREVPASA